MSDPVFSLTNILWEPWNHTYRGVLDDGRRVEIMDKWGDGLPNDITVTSQDGGSSQQYSFNHVRVRRSSGEVANTYTFLKDYKAEGLSETEVEEIAINLSRQVRSSIGDFRRSVLRFGNLETALEERGELPLHFDENESRVFIDSSWLDVWTAAAVPFVGELSIFDYNEDGDVDEVQYTTRDGAEARLTSLAQGSLHLCVPEETPIFQRTDRKGFGLDVLTYFDLALKGPFSETLTCDQKN